MASDSQPAAGTTVMFWVGCVVSALPVVVLTMSAVMKFLMTEDVAKGFEHLGWPESLAVTLGIVEIACTVVYLIPRTAVLGAILLTGYLGGAVATHMRIGDQFVNPIIIGALIWGGLYLRDPRVRALIPVEL